MKNLNFIYGLFFLILFTGCDKEEVAVHDLGSFLISYHIGSSWVDYSYNATIDQNGNLNIEEKSGLNNQYRESGFEMSTEDVLLLKEKLDDLISIELSVKYGFENEIAPTDLPAKKIKYATLNKTDSTYIYFPDENELPNELDEFIQVVQQIIMENDTIIH